MTQLGKRIAQLRLARGMSLENVAEKGDLRPALVWALESGLCRGVAPRDLEGLATALEVPADELKELVPRTPVWR